MCFGDAVPIEEWANDYIRVACQNPYGIETKGNRVLKARLLIFFYEITKILRKYEKFSYIRLDFVFRREMSA